MQIPLNVHFREVNTIRVAEAVQDKLLEARTVKQRILEAVTVNRALSEQAQIKSLPLSLRNFLAEESSYSFQKKEPWDVVGFKDFSFTNLRSIPGFIVQPIRKALEGKNNERDRMATLET